MRNKRKGILMASAILGSAAIVSTGFAAWVVTVNDSETITGNIEVDTVTDNTHLLSFDGVTTADDVSSLDDEIFYGSSSTSTEGWLTNTSDVTQNLTASFTIYVTNYASCDLTVKLTTPTEFKSAAREGQRLFADPTIVVSDFTAVADSDTKSGKATVNITFGWGAYFGTNNPYDFYNAHDALDEIRTGVSYAKDAVETLTIIEKLQGKLNYSILVTTATSNEAKTSGTLA